MHREKRGAAQQNSVLWWRRKGSSREKAQNAVKSGDEMALFRVRAIAKLQVQPQSLRFRETHAKLVVRVGLGDRLRLWGPQKWVSH